MGRQCGSRRTIFCWRGRLRLATATATWSRSFSWAWTAWRTQSPSAGNTSQVHSSWSTASTCSGARPSAPPVTRISLSKDTPPLLKSSRVIRLFGRTCWISTSRRLTMLASVLFAFFYLSEWKFFTTLDWFDSSAFFRICIRPHFARFTSVQSVDSFLIPRWLHSFLIRYLASEAAKTKQWFWYCCFLSNHFINRPCQYERFYTFPDSKHSFQIHSHVFFVPLIAKIILYIPH